MIWHLISSKGDCLGDISQVTTPSFARVNWVFSTTVRLFSQTVCRSVCFFHYSETLHRILESIILVVQMYKIVLTPVTIPRRAVLSYLLPIFVCCYFSGVPLFLENNSIASHYFFIHVLGITQRVTTLIKPFCSIFFFAGSHFEVFWVLILWFAPLFLRAVPHKKCKLRNVLGFPLL